MSEARRRYWEERGRNATAGDINTVLNDIAIHSPNWARMLRAYIRKLERKARG